MKTFNQLLTEITKVYHKFDEQSNATREVLLEELSDKPLPSSKALLTYYNVLLFICAHPLNYQQLTAAENELQRIALHMQKASKQQKQQFVNSGLPSTAVVSTFSHDLLKWLRKNKNYEVSLDSFSATSEKINNALQYTLPAIEREVITLDLGLNQLFKKLSVEHNRRVDFLIDEFEKLEPQTFLKDEFFNSLGMYVKVQTKNQQLSKAYNRIIPAAVYFQTEIIKNFDHKALFDAALPKPKTLHAKQLKELDEAIKNALLVLQRETDPVTYVDEKSIRLYELERGISIAIYGMKPERQLPLESYVGYTLFKNGFPAAYGGGWVFGKRSLFGINIFESMRGGESGYMMCQLLRVYRQAFGVEYFEVEPYQYGKGNPEGIQSGAFWFYYRFGFRPVDTELRSLADAEAAKIASVKGYRSSEETLRKFTHSNLVMNFQKSVPVSLWDIREKVTAVIASEYSGNRSLAQRDCIKQFVKAVGGTINVNSNEKVVLADVAFLVKAMGVKNGAELKYFAAAIKKKPVDVYAYQSLLLKALH